MIIMLIRVRLKSYPMFLMSLIRLDKCLRTCLSLACMYECGVGRGGGYSGRGCSWWENSRGGGDRVEGAHKIFNSYFAARCHVQVVGL